MRDTRNEGRRPGGGSIRSDRSCSRPLDIDLNKCSSRTATGKTKRLLPHCRPSKTEDESRAACRVLRFVK